MIHLKKGGKSEKAPLFSTFDSNQIRIISDVSKKQQYLPNEMIVSEGEIASGLYLILEGEVEVRRHDRLVAKLVSGQFFGETALIENETRSADVVVTTLTKCLILTRSQLLELIAKNPSVAISLLDELIKRYRAGPKSAEHEGVTLSAIVQPEFSESERKQTANMKVNFEFRSMLTMNLFDHLVDCFIQDHFSNRLAAERSGWRTLSEIARGTGLAPSNLYGRQGGVGPPLGEPIRSGLIQVRIFPGERGRGGEIMRLRIVFEAPIVKNYVNARIYART